MIISHGATQCKNTDFYSFSNKLMTLLNSGKHKGAQPVIPALQEDEASIKVLSQPRLCNIACLKNKTKQNKK